MITAIALVFASGASAAEPSFSARGSVEQVYATGLPPAAQTSLLGPAGQVVATRNANDLGGLLFRNVTPGNGYRVRLAATGETSGPLTVLTKQSAPPSTEVYNQTVPSDGYGYMTTRDGTRLAYSVHPPTDVSNVGGVDLPHNPAADSVPSPTLIEYSGYGYAKPDGPVSGIAALANIMGFTVVDVNMRGTGCSGGAFDFFEPLQNLDGYDIIETVARQPWVAHNKVGMLGISYGGISQLFTAQTQPPSLAAITPLSVIDQTQTTLYPGGILNTGFAFNWAKERVHEAQPAGPDSGQPWAYQRIQEGDQTCADNQVLHPEAVDLVGKVRENDHYVPEVADPVSPITFVDKIKVPVFMACQFTDEQTGGHCPTLVKRMTGTDKKWFTFTNGTHVDSLSPEIFNRLYDFLELYVAREAPITKMPVIQAAAVPVFQAVFGIDGMTLPPDPIQLQPTYDLAKAAFEAQPQVRVLFDNGAGNPNAGWPYPGFERSFSSFPIPGTTARSWYLAPSGALANQTPAVTAADAFTWDANARPLTDFSGDTGAGAGGLWTATPGYQWAQDRRPQRRVLRDRAAERRRGRGGRRARGRLGPLLDSQRRPAGDDQRGTAGRQGDVRAERLGARQHAQARRGQEHAARARPQPPRGGRLAIASQLRAGHDPPLLRGAHVPRGLAHPRQDRRAERRPAHLVFQRDGARRTGGGRDRLRRKEAVAPRPPGGAGRERADRASTLPGPARRAVPRLPARCERHAVA